MSDVERVGPGWMDAAAPISPVMPASTTDLWWQVDLGSPHLIHAVVVHGQGPERLDTALPVEIRLSENGHAFRLVHVCDQLGSDILRWSPRGREAARFVRVQTARAAFLKLDDVAIHGRPWTPTVAPVVEAAPEPAPSGVIEEFALAAPLPEEVAPMPFGTAHPGEWSAAAAEPAPEPPAEELPAAATSDDEQWARQWLDHQHRGPDTLLGRLRRSLLGGR